MSYSHCWVEESRISEGYMLLQSLSSAICKGCIGFGGPGLLVLQVLVVQVFVVGAVYLLV